MELTNVMYRLIFKTFGYMSEYTRPTRAECEALVAQFCLSPGDYDIFRVKPE